MTAGRHELPARGGGHPGGHPGGQPGAHPGGHTQRTSGDSKTAGQTASRGGLTPVRLNVSGHQFRTRITESLLAEVVSRLIERDHQLVRLLDRYRILTTDQIAALLFTSHSRARSRLAILHDLRVVDRIRVPDHRIRNQPFHYVLGALGAATLASSRGEDPLKAARNHRTGVTGGLAGGQRIRHTIGTNWVFTALAAEARRRPDARLALWWSEADCRRWYGRLVRPDGRGLWREADREVDFLLEYDRATETSVRVAAKLDGYRKLEHARGQSAWLLIAVPSPGREDHIRAALAGADVPVATAVLPSPPCPHTDVWLPLHGDRRLRLVDLTDYPKPPQARRRAADGGRRAAHYEPYEPEEVIHEYPCGDTAVNDSTG